MDNKMEMAQLLARFKLQVKRALGETVDLERLTRDPAYARQRLNEIDTLTLGNASRRVARYLCQEQEAGNGHIQLCVPKRLIASQLGIQPETFSRILHRLIDAGLIAMERRVIRVLDRPSLANYHE